MNAQNQSITFASLRDAGYPNLIPVSPPDAEIHPGSSLTPAGLGKAPAKRTTQGTWVGMGGWQKHEATPDDIAAWDTWGGNIGMQMGERTAMLDVDVLDAELAKAMLRRARELYPDMPLRIGRKPKWAAMFRVKGDPIPSSRISIDNGTEGHLIEILGVGKQAVVHGVHPSTKAPYDWPHAMPAYDDLPEITFEELARLRNELIVVAEDMGYSQGVVEMDSTSDHASSELGTASSDPELTAELLANLRNDYSWDGWFSMGLAAAGAKLGAYGEHAFHSFSKGSPKYDEQTTHELYKMCCRVAKGKRGAGTIHALAREQGLLKGQLKKRHAQAVDARRSELTAQRHADEVAEIMGQLPPGWHADVACRFDARTDDLSRGVDAIRAEKLAAGECAAEQAGSTATEPSEEPSSQADSGGINGKTGAPGETHMPALPPGLVGRLIKYGSEIGHTEADTHLLPGALACISASSGHRFVAEVGTIVTPLNVMVLSLAGTSVGKTTTMKLAKMGAHNNPLVQSAGDINSRLGLHRMMVDGGVLWARDEFGIFLKHARANRTSNEAMLLSLTMEIYNEALGTLPAHSVRNPKDCLPEVEGPFAVMCAVSTPDTLWEGVTHEDIKSGQLNRLLLFRGASSADSKPLQKTGSGPLSVPQDIADALERIKKTAQFTSGPPSGDHGMPRSREYEYIRRRAVPIEADDDAFGAFERFRKVCFQAVVRSQSGARDGFAELWGRALENAIKLAAIIALGDWAMQKAQPGRIEITAEHAWWGIVLSSESVKSWEAGAANEMGGSVQSRDALHILNLIKKLEGKSRDGWVQKSVLARSDYRRLGAAARNEAIVELEEQDKIKIRQDAAATGGQKPKHFYRTK